MNVRVLPPPEPYLTRQELASRLRVSTKTIDRWVQAGMPSETWGLRARRFQLGPAVEWARKRRRP